MNKACPVVTRKQGLEILAFLHPLAGRQLVKGTIEASETVQSACERELLEESGIHGEAVRFLGEWNAGFENQTWGFCTMRIDVELPDSWEHLADEDGGRVFKFFWQPLDAELNAEWHPLFVGAIGYIIKALTTRCSAGADKTRR